MPIRHHEPNVLFLTVTEYEVIEKNERWQTNLGALASNGILLGARSSMGALRLQVSEIFLSSAAIAVVQTT
ncbi:MAG: hypothetical protein ACI97A_000353 [Planctomycetota bacterium]|jgi:hypothetical protein